MLHKEGKDVTCSETAFCLVTLAGIVTKCSRKVPNVSGSEHYMFSTGFVSGKARVALTRMHKVLILKSQVCSSDFNLVQYK